MAERCAEIVIVQPGSPATSGGAGGTVNVKQGLMGWVTVLCRNSAWYGGSFSS